MTTAFYRRDRSQQPLPLSPGYKSTVLRAPVRPLHALEQTSLEQTGPALGHTPLGPLDHDLIRNAATTGDALGERIYVFGRVLDENARPVPNALIEVWQANAAGHYAHPEDPGETEDGFRGWGRVITDFDTGEWGFDTVKPGAVMGRGGRLMAPHLNLWIVARGINIGLNTRLYFDDEADANAADPVLGLIEWESRRDTLIARREIRDGAPVYRFDIRLQGADETVFFDI